VSDLDSKKNAARIAFRRQREARIRAERAAAIFAPEPGRPPPPFVSVLEFRQAVGVSHATAHRWLERDEVASVKVRGRRLIPYAELERLRGKP
jgi:hypothetical protein